MIFTKTVASGIRVAQVLGTMYCAGIVTYLLVGLVKSRSWNGRTIAVEVISGAGFLYATTALLGTVCLLQKSFFQFGSILFDLIYCGAFIAVAVLLRSIYSQSCNASPATIPWMERSFRHYFVNCQLTKGVFIVACILALLFLLSAIISLLAHRKTKKEAAYGPSPTNGYTSGRGRKNRELDTEATAGGAAVPAVAALTRPSHDSKFTDATEKTSEGLPAGNTTVGAGREYLAPRAKYTGTERAVSPVPSSQIFNGNEKHSRSGQYAAAGALAGGAAAATHHHNQNKLQTNETYNDNNLPRHPTPNSGTTYSTPEAARKMQDYTGHHPHLDGAIIDDGNNAMYSELGSSPVAGSYAAPRNPNSFYPSNGTQQRGQLSELDTSNTRNINLFDDDKRYSEYMSPTLPNTPGNELDQAGFGYGNGVGHQGQTGGNQVSRLPEIGREEPRRF